MKIVERKGHQRLIWTMPGATPEEIAATVKLWRSLGIDCDAAIEGEGE